MNSVWFSIKSVRTIDDVTSFPYDIFMGTVDVYMGGIL